jgi:hypothetical protein
VLWLGFDAQPFSFDGGEAGDTDIEVDEPLVHPICRLFQSAMPESRQIISKPVQGDCV